MRIGYGFDSHPFGPQRLLKLGGVTVPSQAGLAGHSDSDVVLHAVADALFGAMGEPDIGEQFPPAEPKWRDADSALFVRAACERMRRMKLKVGNLDMTVIADEPKLSPHKAGIRSQLAELLGVGAAQVSVKAKTTEGMAGGKPGIAVHAVVLLIPE